jgi:zinc transport system permease protein
MDILELLHYTFFQHALLGSLFASIACGIIGTYIVTRRLVFISGGITHASFGGIGLGLYADISPLLSLHPKEKFVFQLVWQFYST